MNISIGTEIAGCFGAGLPVLPSIGYFAVEESFMEFVDNGGTINNG